MIDFLDSYRGVMECFLPCASSEAVLKSQYILVTHSETLVNSKTINNVKRFALDSDNNTVVASPVVPADQKTLIKILDNTRSTYAFFAAKIVLVEGDTDRYFFKSVFNHLHPDLEQEIAILDIGRKGNFEKWKKFFESFGLRVYYIGDFDNVFSLEISGTTLIPKGDKIVMEEDLRQIKLDGLTPVEQKNFKDAYDSLTSDANFIIRPKLIPWRLLCDRFKAFIKLSNLDIANEAVRRNSDIHTKIENQYPLRIYILKEGALEKYTATNHGDLNKVIKFCEDEMPSWLTMTTTDEVKLIVEEIARD